MRETMTEKPAIVPEGYHTVTPWIIAKGADGLVDFIEKTFGGKEKAGSRILNADGLIGHVEVQIGDSVILLFDHREGWPATPAFLRVYVENADSSPEEGKGCRGHHCHRCDTALFWRTSRTNTGSMGQLLVDSRTDRRGRLAGDGKADARPERN